VKKNIICGLSANIPITSDIFTLHFNWEGPSPKAGQFFMIRPARSSVFLGRPISIFEFNPATNTLKFLIIRHGKGTDELSKIRAGEEVELTGPLGNSWAEFLPENGKAALIGGGAGVAPLCALVAEKENYFFHFFAGFKTGFREKEKEDAILGAALKARKVIVAAEDGRNAHSGRIVDFLFEPENYNVILACGPVPMLKALKEKCKLRGVECYVSMEQRMACGAGACLGCTINTVKGYRHCCSDGPIFNAQELYFDD
jgi:NAD(P)H-flavin reductase